MGFADRFRRLEIPEERRRVDWSFLDAPMRFPAPLPLADQPLLVTMDGRSWVPRAPLVPDGDGAPSLLLYRDAHVLEEIAAPGALEAAWRAEHAGEIEHEQRRFLASVPTGVLREQSLRDEACEILRLGLGSGPGREAEPAFTVLLEGARLLRIHGRLYDLVTLREYVAIFEKAIAPDCFRFLQSLPATVAPGEMLAHIEERLGDIHARARSPLRNKMSTLRARIDGVTYLPIYREETAAMFDAGARLLDRRAKLAALGTLS